MKKPTIHFYITIAFIILLYGGIALTSWFIWFRPTYDKAGIPNGLVSYDFVNSRPEAKLYYPNGKIYAPNGRGMIDNSSVAYTGAVMATSDPPEKIYTWYKNWLLLHGWQYDEQAVGGLGSTQISLQGYTKDGRGLKSRESFYVAINNPKMLGWVIGEKLPADVTIFEFSYSIRPNEKSN